MKLTSLAFLAALIAFAATASAHNGTRIYLTLENGQLMTNLDNFQGAHNITPHVSIFQTDFGVISASPLVIGTQFPGLSGSVTPNTALPEFSSISFNILDAVKYWDGIGENVTFTTAPRTISVSSGATFVTSSTGPVAGFTLIASTTTADGWHLHPTYSLNPAAINLSYDGVYALQLSMTSNNSTTAPFWIVFNQDAPTGALSKAAAALSAVPAPEPASLAILALSAILLRRRRA